MKNWFKRRYRIVVKYWGFQPQVKYWFNPLWIDIGWERETEARALEEIERHSFIGTVVKEVKIP